MKLLGISLTGKHSTFALSFWYAIKMYLNFEIASVTIIIMSVNPRYMD